MSKIQPQASGTRIAQIRTASWTERPQDLAIDMFIFLGMCKLCWEIAEILHQKMSKRCLKVAQFQKRCLQKLKKLLFSPQRWAPLSTATWIGSSITLSSSLQQQVNLASTIFVLLPHTHIWDYCNHYRIPNGQPTRPLLILRKCLQLVLRVLWEDVSDLFPVVP